MMKLVGGTILLVAALLAAPAIPTTTAFVNKAHLVARTSSFQSSSGLAMAKSQDDKIDFGQVALASLMGLALLTNPNPAFADGQTEKFKLPPIDYKDKTRCSLNSSTIGQANAARDKLYDLRECNLSGKNGVGFDLSGVIMGQTDLSNANMQEAYFSKGYLRGM
jgi:uncharacterized protein YjbI with pentapeptide repeats